MAVYNPQAILKGDEPGPWCTPVPVAYTQRDVCLYAVGIGTQDLRFVYEQHPQFAVFPTFAIRWGGLGLTLDPVAMPPSPGPLSIDAERTTELSRLCPRKARCMCARGSCPCIRAARAMPSRNSRAR
jgi:peroxisomal enoyl-CoA hydratase 2